MIKRTVCVTGVGILCAVGSDVPSFWRALLAGACGVGPVTRFPAEGLRSPMVAEVPGVVAYQGSRVDGLAVRAAREALDSAGLDALPEDAGIATGACVGGLPESEDIFGVYSSTGRLSRGLRTFTRHVPATTTDVLASLFGAQGPRAAVVNACSSGSAAIGQGALWIEGGESDCVLTGASDALSRLTVGGFNSLRLVSSSPPMPFDRDRSGMAVGEGAAFLVLESSDHAEKRGAEPLAVLEGFGFSVDGYHATAPHPDGRGALVAMRAALLAAGTRAVDVDHVNAHGTGTRANDEAEARAIAELLGPRAHEVPVVSLKGAIGHCLGAAGAMEAVASVLSLRDQVVPPCVGFTSLPDNLRLRIPAACESLPLRKVMSVNLAFGGNNAALLFGRRP